MKRKTNEEIDKEIYEVHNGLIKRIGDYHNNKEKIEWECNKCGYHWFARTDNIIFSHRGCPKCHNQVHLTNQIVDERLQQIHGNSITRIGNVKNNGTKILWKCNKCNKTWDAIPNSVVGKQKTGCPYCSGRMKLSMSDVYKKINKIHKGKIICLSKKYINNISKMKWKCNKCGYTWETSYTSVSKNGCPKCSHKAKLTNSIIDERLNKIYNGKIIRIDNYTNVHKRMKFKCNICGHIFEDCVNHTIGEKRGCTFCHISNGEKIIVRWLESNNYNYKKEYTFDECKYKRKLPFDFAIFDKNYKVLFVIEYDGIQHFQPVKFSSKTTKEEMENDFNVRKLRDAIKTNFCNKNNIKLIRIKYKKQDKNFEKNIIEDLNSQINKIKWW